MSEKLELYVFTTPTWKEKGLLKVGHCSRGRHEERIKNELATKSPEQPNILWVKDLPESKTDHHIHKQMEKNGIERKSDSVGREWFYAKLEDVKKAYNEVVHGISREKVFP